MKGGLYLVYTSLLTISVLSSCVLFILVVSEASLPNTFGVNNESSLSNETVRENANKELGLELKLDKEPDPLVEKSLETKPTVLSESELTFAEALSQNSVIANGLPDTGQPPILLSLADTAKLELQDTPEKPSKFGNDSEQRNDSGPLGRSESARSEPAAVAPAPPAAAGKAEKDVAEAPLVVQAKPMHEAKLTDEAFIPATPAPKLDEAVVDKTIKNETEHIPVKAAPHEDIPSFSEWAQKQLAEAEKQDTVLNHSSQPSHSNTIVSNKSTKLRSKNYASPACGAKVVAVNPEAGSASAILSPNMDEYMLNTCTSRIWFVVELCEPLQAQKIEMANFELFSSSPKDFAVYFSDRFPTREWTSVGQFTAKNDKEVQSFDLFPHLFGKFIKVELLSHYGAEHYCPISLFKVYGTSEFEVLEKENSQHANTHLDEDDDEILGELPDAVAADAEGSKNLFGSARDAVMSIMKKAAQVLVKSEAPQNSTVNQGENKTGEMYKKCCSPSHIVVCDNCSDILYNAVYDLISCSSNKLMNMINKIFIQDTLRNTDICLKYGLDFKNKRTKSFRNDRASYMSALFSENYIGAMCNFLAIIDKKVVLNTSYETELNVTSNLTLDKVSKTLVDESNLHEIVQIPFKDNTSNKEDSVAKPDKHVSNIQDPVSVVSNTDKKVEDIKDNNIESLKPNAQPIQKNDSAIDKSAEVKPIEKNNKHVELPKDNGRSAVINKPDEPTEKNVQQPDPTINVKAESAIDVKVDKPAADVDKTPTHITAPPAITVEEVNEQLVIDAESFLSDLDQLINDPTIQTTATPSVQKDNQGQTPPKESVFLRLSNRVKTLERNMSLSAQYLEELSKRYKKQVEEMQKSFEKTLLQMSEERKKTEERDQQNLEQMSLMHEQLTQLNAVVLVLLEERDSWLGNITFFKFFVCQAIVVGIVLYYINKKRIPLAKQIPSSRKPQKSKKNQERKLRRKSVEGVSGHETPASRTRRPSEEALHIARRSADAQSDSEGDWQVVRKNRRRKTSIVHRLPLCDPVRPDVTRPDSIGHLRDNVIPLDEEEFIAPVSEPFEFPETAGPIIPAKGSGKLNGSIFNNMKGASKAVKSRRLSSPAFFRSALSRQSSRSAPSPALPLNGKPEEGPRATSESPPASVYSHSRESSIQNGVCQSETGSAKKSKKRSLKNIFKKVF